MDERIRSVLDAAFPDREVESVEAAEPSWNDNNETVAVAFADDDADRERIYLKIAADGDASRIARERAVMEYVGTRSSVPVPTVLASETAGEVPYLATAAMDGQRRLELWYDEEADEERHARLARQIGRSLARLHELRFESHGHVVGGDADGLELETGPWTDVLVERIERMADIAGDGRFDHHFEEVVAAVEANRDLLDGAPAALVHGDPAHPNCVHAELDTGDERVGLLDWEISHVGDPARELRRTCRLQFGPLRSVGPERLVSAFHAGYRETAGSLPEGFEARRPVYDAVTFLGASGFFEKWEHRADDPTEELAAEVRAEMDRRLAAIR
ncbi:phosphotransferase [Halorussus gelatinilyticus]|uniref:Phosphotransferase n=1 Tax=Halorussus gelatinilyticus TaxID=2937524 RepID=A0A8U0IEX0_9EURY|nr:phosphotransferase [Halorussus gelatinilyticus]UPV99447.1 phosphotransferase [Halorussus gelatinilyticus]